MVHAASSAVSAWGTAVSGGIGMGARCWAVSASGVGGAMVSAPRNFFKWADTAL